MITAHQAIERLQQGNRRFVDDQRAEQFEDANARRRQLTGGQSPFAIILGCSDSRVPAEIVFDQGLGDLFVIRVAGNIVAPSQVGSVEFAAEQFNTRLVVVLGHTTCGAIGACLSELQQPRENQSPNLRAIVDRIRPAVAPLLAADPGQDPAQLEKQAGRANVMASTNQLRHGSAILEDLIDNNGLVVVGAEYDMVTGQVDFFDDQGLTVAAKD